MKKSIFIYPFIALLTACANTVNTNPDKIFLGEVGDLGYIKNISVNESTSGKAGALQRITVSGETSVDTKLYYSVIWFDANDTKINTTLSKPVMASVRKGQPFFWSAVAPNEKAASYKVFVSTRAIEQ